MLCGIGQAERPGGICYPLVDADLRRLLGQFAQQGAVLLGQVGRQAQRIGECLRDRGGGPFLKLAKTVDHPRSQLDAVAGQQDFHLAPRKADLGRIAAPVLLFADMTQICVIA
ncbi:hypothetical protein D9M69_448730 [compost metagenome]